MHAPVPQTRTDEVTWGSTSRAFTLVESLVAASVILFALSVLAPALLEARDQNHLAGCLANLRGIGQASLVYAGEDPNEIMIPVPYTDYIPEACGAIEWGGKAGSGQSWIPLPGQSIFGTGAFRGPAHRPLNPYIYKRKFINYNPVEGPPNPGPGGINYLNDTRLNLDIYRCPSDTGYAGGGFLHTAHDGRETDRNETAFKNEGLTAYDHYGTSYVANCYWIIGGLAGNRIRSQSVYLTPLSRVPYPAHSIAYQEGPSRYAHLWGSWEGSGCEWCNYSARFYGSHEMVPGWHGQDFHFTVTFADGHAAVIEMQGCERPAPHLGYGNYPPSMCGPDADLYVCNRCVTMRGPGWSLDTLPAEPVLTPYYGGKGSEASPDSVSEAR